MGGSVLYQIFALVLDVASGIRRGENKFVFIYVNQPVGI